MAKTKIVRNAAASGSPAEQPCTKSPATKARRQARPSPKPVELERVPDRLAGQPARPGGKLGVLVDCLATEAGATANELAASTGWQKHTVLGALSRLRSRGFAMRLELVGERKAYRLLELEGAR